VRAPDLPLPPITNSPADLLLVLDVARAQIAGIRDVTPADYVGVIATARATKIALDRWLELAVEGMGG
jgi:hypothetical protein